jgi:hypothetical protein
MGIKRFEGLHLDQLRNLSFPTYLARQPLALYVGALFMMGYLYIVYASYTAAPFFDSWRLFVQDREFGGHILNHNEHIINFTAFVFWIDNSILSGYGFLQLILIAGMLIAIGALFIREIIEPRAWGAAALALAACLSGTQYTSIVWSFQVGYVGCFALGTAAIWALSHANEKTPSSIWLTASTILAFLSALAMAAGVVLLGVLAVYALVLPVRRGVKLTYAAVTLLGMVLLISLSEVGQGGYGAKSLFGAIVFSLAVLGSLFATAVDLRWLGFNLLPDAHIINHVGLSVLVGVGLCTFALVAFSGVVERVRSDGDRLSRYWSLPLGAWAVLSAAAIGYGRSGMAANEALSPRYVTISVLFTGATLVAMSRARPGLIRCFGLNLSLLGLVALLALAQVDRMAQSEVAGRRFENAESALLNSAFTAPDINYLYPNDMDVGVRRVVDVMKLRGISVFGESRYRIIGRNLFAGSFAFSGNCLVRLTEITRLDTYTRVQGTYSLARMSFSPNTIVVADRDSKVVAAGTLRRPMLGLRQEGRQRGFVVNVNTSELPEEGKASIFFVDVDRLKFCYAGTF